MRPVTSFHRVATALFLLAAFCIGEAAARGRGGGGIDIDFDSLDLPPLETGAFAVTVIWAIVAAYFTLCAIGRFKAPVLPPGADALPYQIGKLFPTFLFLHTLVYLAYSICWAVDIPLGFGRGLPVMWFVGQLADVLRLAMFLTILSYRERIQLNPYQPLFNLKSFLDGCILSIYLILGIAMDVVEGNATATIRPNITKIIRQADDIVQILRIVAQVIYFIGCLNVVVTSVMLYSRLKRSGTNDMIIRKVVHYVSPALLMNAVWLIILWGISFDLVFSFTHNEELLLADRIISGFLSVFVINLALTMGLVPKPSKDDASKAAHKA